jgi:hypothetical protein
MARTFTGEDEGKTVIADGQQVGVLVEVEEGRAYVEPEPSITESLMAKLGWGEADVDAYPIYDDAVAAITDDEIRLSTPLEGRKSGGEPG